MIPEHIYIVYLISIHYILIITLIYKINYQKYVIFLCSGDDIFPNINIILFYYIYEVVLYKISLYIIIMYAKYL